MPRRFILFAWFLGFACKPAQAQSGFVMLQEHDRYEIPFEYTNNFIIVKVTLQGFLQLRFIYDTGAEHTLLTKKDIAEILQLPYDRTFRLVGSDMKTELTAYLTRGVSLDIENQLFSQRHDLLVLDDDYFRFEEYSGINVHGILAGNVFSRYTIRIDYNRKRIVLMNREHFKPAKKEGLEMPVEVFRNKIYITTTARLYNDSLVQLKLLMDTGAGLPLLLFTNTNPLLTPPPNAIHGNIGMGLGGYLDGFVGRIPEVQLGEPPQREMVAYFQSIDSSIQDREFLNGRNGLLGNTFFERFMVTLDYDQEKLWLRPNSKNNEAYTFDRSGIILLATGKNLDKLLIQYIIPGSPAEEAGLKAGDRITRIGFFPVSFFKMSTVIKKFKGDPGKTIKLTVRRNGKKLKVQVVLRNLI